MSHEQAANALNGVTDDEDDMFLDDDAGEEVPQDDDAAMDSDVEDGDQRQEIQLHNDSIAHFDAHAGNSIFCIAQHPTHPNIIATGGGDDEEGNESGFGFLFDVSSAPEHTPNTERTSIVPLQKFENHTDSINAITFTLPDGNFLLTAGLDGRLNAYQHQPSSSTSARQGPYTPLASAQEVDEINFLIPCPHPAYPQTIALGASDGSVWVYTVDPSDPSAALAIVQTYYIHTGRCEAGAWSPDGKLLATVSEDGSFYVWDVFGEAAAVGIVSAGQQYVVGLTAQDERFRVDGGLFSVAIAPNGAIAAIGGAEGQIRVVSLPRFGTGEQGSQAGVKRGAGAKSKSSGAKVASDKTGAGQAGTILAALAVQSDSVETLAFAASPLTLLAAGSVDGSIAVFDTGKNFTLRRRIGPISDEDEEGHAIVKVKFVDGKGSDSSWLLTSCGLDGVLRRWDLRSSGPGQGLLGEWKGHQGGGDGGGIMDFVQGLDTKVITAGDDGVSLLFDMARIP